MRSAVGLRKLTGIAYRAAGVANTGEALAGEEGDAASGSIVAPVGKVALRFSAFVAEKRIGGKLRAAGAIFGHDCNGRVYLLVYSFWMSQNALGRC